jgi:uncharacterized protein (TIGR02246 family)
MNSTISAPATATSADESTISSLYQRMLNYWTRRDASDLANLYEENGSLIGFDGSRMNGRAEIESAIRGVFAKNATGAYVGKIKEVRFLGGEVAVVRAVAGMIPPGQSDINPAINAIQTLIAVKRAGEWFISLFQNTPAQFHGRPELATALSQELRELL